MFQKTGLDYSVKFCEGFTTESADFSRKYYDMLTIQGFEPSGAGLANPNLENPEQINIDKPAVIVNPSVIKQAKIEEIKEQQNNLPRPKEEPQKTPMIVQFIPAELDPTINYIVIPDSVG